MPTPLVFDYPDKFLRIKAIGLTTEDQLDKGLDQYQLFNVYQVYYPFDTGRQEQVGSFRLEPYPANCGIVVSSYMNVDFDKRGRGYATRLQPIKQDIAKKFGYSLMQATVVCTNIAEVSILLKSGWKVISTFKNARTGNNCFIFQKEI